jgi:hypothetical protein
MIYALCSPVYKYIYDLYGFIILEVHDIDKEGATFNYYKKSRLWREMEKLENQLYYYVATSGALKGGGIRRERNNVATSGALTGKKEGNKRNNCCSLPISGGPDEEWKYCRTLLYPHQGP